MRALGTWRLHRAGTGASLLVVLASVLAACEVGGSVEPPPTLAGAVTTTDEASGEVSGPEPAPIVLAGIGPSSERIRIREAGPLVASGSFSGSGPVSVVARGAATEILFFTGPARLGGRRAAWSIAPGLFTLSIRAPGPWRIELRQPRPDPDSDAQLVGEFNGTGFDAVPVQVGVPGPTEIRVDYRGRGRFGIFLVPYKRFGAPIELVEAQDGPLRDRFAVRVPSSESYLLQVDATGPWRLTFE